MMEKKLNRIRHHAKEILKKLEKANTLGNVQKIWYSADCIATYAEDVCDELFEKE